MLIEQSAYANRWRRVSPGAKGLFALCGFVAAFLAANEPWVGGLVVASLAAATLIGARVRLGHYLRVAAPPLFFLAISSLSLAFSLDNNQAGDGLAVHTTATGLQQVTQVTTRSLGGLAALLFLVLTTPLTDLIALLRRLKMPELLLDIMVLCYRTLFVFSEAMHDMRTAQAARLGYASALLSLRSLGEMIANLTVQIWQRSQALHQAALARNNDGPLRFLPPVYAHAARDTAIAAGAGAALVALSLGAA